MVVVKALLAVLPILAAAPTALANHFILTHKMLVTTRLDPIVFPGVISGHVHTIAGASSFDKTMDYAKSRSASCTTAVVSEDKSNYWTPQMYYYNPLDATFTMITVSVMNTYYLTRPGYDGEKITAFPDGLRMISGNPFRKTFDASNPDNAAISFVCLGGGPETRDDPEWFQRNSLFNHNCPGGMRAQVNFRSCWDGKNLDTSDHASHMAWPSGGVDGGTCPSTHPVHLPMLFYEVVYDVQKFPYNNNGTTWVFAQGDTTGYGFHGDFVNGWPSLINGTNILQQAIDHCEVGGVLDNCPPFVPFLDNAAAGACQPANPKVDEDIGDGHGIKALPGNNPVTIAGSTYVSNANNSAIGYIGTTSTIPIDYSYVGCIAEGSLGRALTGASWISATAMTRGACVSFCSDKGFAYAGVEFGQECYCDNMLRNGASSSTLLGESQCGTSCPALNTENCGGGSAITLFVAQSKVVAGKQSAVASGFVEVGCVAEGQNGRALTGPTFTSSTMSRGACTSFCASKGMPLAGVEYGSEWYVGSPVNASFHTF
ncbi:hypothetical protein QFC22_005902 [Naganishia vaughanmartiniae]|uniref:Uncharacterized protein n=1 Tax=Naganishia vaughanmartiniae TaxID=1424756 RepID=A0ACC2WR45_9TREE|nr:hypothetical protein QFC22_005902 [Naganishia vaughanmartiniae]